MGYKISFRRPAEKGLGDMPARERNRLLDRIGELAADPFPPGSRKLKGHDGLHRVRVGNWRAIYREPDEDGIIDVLKIGHRRTVYRFH